MTTKAPPAARITNPTRSHSLSFDHRGIDKEELFPVLEIDLPRVGTVEVRFACDRYRASVWHEDDTRTEEMGAWRIYAREFEPAHGIGDAARRLANEAGVPIIRAWLASPAYKVARQAAAARMLRHFIADRGTTTYGVLDSRRALAAHGAELDAPTRRAFKRAVDALDKAGELLGGVR